MKKLFLLALAILVSATAMGQVAYLQYRVVPGDRQQEFVEKETKYWAKVAQSAIDKGQMVGWSLWRKVGITEAGAPNYVFVNLFENAESIDQGAVWSDSNMQAMGVNPGMVETNTFAPTAFDYWMQLEDMIEGDYKYAIVNYAMPDDVGGFIEENKSLWKPLHQQNIDNGVNGMKSWGVMSVIHPRGKLGRFSVLTWDGFDKMSDVMNYLRYQGPGQADGPWQDVISKSKMGEFMPDGFEYSIVYEKVMMIAADE